MLHFNGEIILRLLSNIILVSIEHFLTLPFSYPILKASIVTVIRLVNDAVDTVDNEGI